MPRKIRQFGSKNALLSVVDDMRKAGETDSASPLYSLIVDEMNRANLPRVFGELMYLFEYRGKTIRLQCSEEFALPPNLHFIGTMNRSEHS
jgi:5-methylcytosine-specific restriction enzyme B